MSAGGSTEVIYPTNNKVWNHRREENGEIGGKILVD